MTRKKNPISPENVGQLFWKPGEDIPYRLEECGSEPLARMRRVDNMNLQAIPAGEPISTFKDFVLVKGRPEQPKQTRSDKNGTHQRRTKKEQDEVLRRSKQVPGGAGEDDTIQVDKDLTKKVLGDGPLA